MHFTGTVYRNPYWPTFPLLEITQGCTHNKCKFCTMYRDVPFRMSPMEHIEEDLQEIASIAPNATTRISVELITFLNLFFSIAISPKLPHIQIRLYVTSCSFQHIVSITRQQTPNAES